MCYLIPELSNLWSKSKLTKFVIQEQLERGYYDQHTQNRWCTPNDDSKFQPQVMDSISEWTITCKDHKAQMDFKNALHLIIHVLPTIGTWHAIDCHVLQDRHPTLLKLTKSCMWKTFIQIQNIHVYVIRIQVVSASYSGWFFVSP